MPTFKLYGFAVAPIVASFVVLAAIRQSWFVPFCGLLCVVVYGKSYVHFFHAAQNSKTRLLDSLLLLTPVYTFMWLTIPDRSHEMSWALGRMLGFIVGTIIFAWTVAKLRTQCIGRDDYPVESPVSPAREIAVFGLMAAFCFPFEFIIFGPDWAIKCLLAFCTLIGLLNMSARDYERSDPNRI